VLTESERKRRSWESSFFLPLSKHTEAYTAANMRKKQEDTQSRRRRRRGREKEKRRREEREREKGSLD
jgi:hypothetical protein